MYPLFSRSAQSSRKRSIGADYDVHVGAGTYQLCFLDRVGNCCLCWTGSPEQFYLFSIVEATCYMINTPTAVPTMNFFLLHCSPGLGSLNSAEVKSRFQADLAKLQAAPGGSLCTALKTVCEG